MFALPSTHWVGCTSLKVKREEVTFLSKAALTDPRLLVPRKAGLLDIKWRLECSKALIQLMSSWFSAHSIKSRQRTAVYQCYQLLDVPYSFVAEVLGWPKPFWNIKLLDQTVARCLSVTERSFLYRQVLQEVTQVPLWQSRHCTGDLHSLTSGT